MFEEVLFSLPPSLWVSRGRSVPWKGSAFITARPAQNRAFFRCMVFVLVLLFAVDPGSSYIVVSCVVPACHCLYWLWIRDSDSDRDQDPKIRLPLWLKLA